MGSLCHQCHWQGASGSPVLIAVCVQAAVNVINYLCCFICELPLHFSSVMLQCYFRANFMIMLVAVFFVAMLFGTFGCYYGLRSVNLWGTVVYNDVCTHAVLL